MHVQTHSCILMLRIPPVSKKQNSFTCLVLYIPPFVCYICSEYGAFSEIASQSPFSPFDKAEGELSAYCCRYKVAGRSLEMERRRGAF